MRFEGDRGRSSVTFSDRGRTSVTSLTAILGGGIIKARASKKAALDKEAYNR